MNVITDSPDNYKPRCISNDEFDDHLHRIVSQMGTAAILSYGDVYTALSEALNNEVIGQWEKEHAVELAAEAIRLGERAGEYDATFNATHQNPYGIDTEPELWEGWQDAYEEAFELHKK